MWLETQFWNYYSKIGIICPYSGQLLYYPKVCDLKNTKYSPVESTIWSVFPHLHVLHHSLWWCGCLSSSYLSPFRVFKVLHSPNVAMIILDNNCCLQSNYNYFLSALGFYITLKTSMNNLAKGRLWTESTHPPTLLLAELSGICELAIHLVSPTTVLACGRRPMSLTVIIRCREDFRTLTASSCGTLRKLRPLTSKIWSPTCGEGRAHRGMVGGAEQGGKGGPGCRTCGSKVIGQRERWHDSGTGVWIRAE